MHGAGDLHHHGGGFTWWKKLIIVHAIRETSPANELHGEIRLPFMLAHFVNGYDVRVIEQRSKLCFTLKAKSFLLCGKEDLAQHLQGHTSSKPYVLRLIHHAHPAHRDLAFDSVVPEAR